MKKGIIGNLNKAIYLLLLSIFPTIDVCSQVVSEAEAREAAVVFLSGVSRAKVRSIKGSLQQPQLELVNHCDEYFIFNDKINGGYIIVSGDKKLPSVLGYSYDGFYDNENVPINMRVWLDGYARQVAYIRTHLDVRIFNQEQEVGVAISPLLECEWGQYEPFNNNCPQWASKACPTGCVATAMAQLLHYYKWPQKTTKAISGYTAATNKIKIPEMPKTTIDWDNIVPTYHSQAIMVHDGDPGEWYTYYSNDYSEEQAEAVATLMTLCGTALKMDYNQSGSSSSIGKARNVLRDYFDYEEGIRLFCDNYDQSKWREMIYEELAGGHPVLYDGEGIPDGHAFIIDGYDKGGYFHVNWGWGGLQNAYFLLTVLTPNDYDFSTGQSAVLGVRPSKPESVCAYGVLNEGKMTFYYDKDKGNRTGVIYNNIRSCASNPAITECVIDPSFADHKLWSLDEYFKDSENLETIKGLKYLNTTDALSMWQMFDGCKSLKKIDLKGFHTNDATNMGGMFANCSSLTTLDLSEFVTSNVTRTDYMFQDCRELSTIYVGDGWSMNKVKDDWWMFVNDFALRGANGTEYYYPNYGVEYAHIDGGPNNPGYLSASITDSIEEAVEFCKTVRVYNLLGMCVYAGVMNDNVWRQLPPGDYIINGKLIIKSKYKQQ